MAVQYWEYKTLLVPTKFSDFSESVDDYRKQVIEPVAAAISELHYKPLHKKPIETTNVEFYDTPNADFNNNHYLVRWRYTPTKSAEGKPTRKHHQEGNLTLKYRQSNESAVANSNVKSTLSTNDIKLKDEVLLPKSISDFPGMRSNYSHDNELSPVSSKNLHHTVDKWAKLFPALGKLHPSDKTASIVNEIVVQQSQVDICKLKFKGSNGGEIEAKGDIALWVNTKQPQYAYYLAAEFSYSFKSLDSPPPPDALAVCSNFYLGLQGKAYQAWIQDKGTKTSAIYNPPPASTSNTSFKGGT